MSFIQNFNKYRIGVVKAKRDISLAKDHLDISNRLDYANPFWGTLGRDVDNRYWAELEGYMTTKNRFMTRWLRAHPLAAATAEFEAAIIKSEAEESGAIAIEVSADLASLIVSGNLTEEYVAELAKQHGHDSPEEECESIAILRKILYIQQGEFPETEEGTDR